MLTVFHTADWHLGQSFFGYDRLFEHSRFLEWLLDELRLHQPDALLVAGDIYDSINPSADSQRQFYQFIADAHKALPALQIIIIAGNHDAAARLEAPSEVLRSLNVTVLGTVPRNEQGEIEFSKCLVPLFDTAGAVRAVVLAIPFLRPSDVPLVPDAADPYLEGMREFYRRTTEEARQLKAKLAPSAALIAMGHCHLSGGEESRDSERRLVIGGAESVSADLFAEDLTYVALGHLHKAQQFREGGIRYSGSPIPLSFSESSYRHRVFRLTFEQDQLASVDESLIPRTVPLITVPERCSAPITELLPMLEQLPDTSPPGQDPDQYPFLEVRVLEEGPDPARRRRIEQALAGRPVRLASIKVDRPQAVVPINNADTFTVSHNLQMIGPEEVFLSTFRQKYQREPDAALLKAFHEILLQEVRSS